MGDDDAFLRAIADAPGDDAPRLVYADWLDEHGQPDRAEYLRLACGYPENPVLDRLRELAPLLDPIWRARVHGETSGLPPHYELVRLLAHGRLTDTYEATPRHPNLRDRRVALRVLRSREHAHGFHDACRILAAIDHPHIPPLYEVGESDGRMYSARRFVDGDDLHRVLRDGPIDPPAVVRIISAAAAALDALHDRRVLHVSVHPRHLLRGRDGSIWLIGLGEWLVPEVAVGYPLHPAPEELDRHLGPVGPPTDVYQLAETAAWLLTGRHPFQSYSGVENLMAAKQRPDSWRTGSLSNLSWRLTRVFRRALCPDPDRRYPTPGEFAAALANGFQQRSRSWWQIW